MVTAAVIILLACVPSSSTCCIDPLLCVLVPPSSDAAASVDADEDDDVADAPTTGEAVPISSPSIITVCVIIIMIKISARGPVYFVLVDQRSLTILSFDNNYCADAWKREAEAFGFRLSAVFGAETELFFFGLPEVVSCEAVLNDD